MADVTRASSREDWLMRAAEDEAFCAAQAGYLRRLELWMLLLAGAGFAAFAAGFYLWLKAADHDGWIFTAVGLFVMVVGLTSSSECRLRIQLLRFASAADRPHKQTVQG